MQPQSDGDFKKLLSDVIKKQIVILGPFITLAKARNVKGLTISDDGTVTAIEGDPQQITQQLVEQFMELSGLIVKKTMEPLFAGFPSMAAAQITGATPTPPAPQPATKPATSTQQNPAPTGAGQPPAQQPNAGMKTIPS